MNQQQMSKLRELRGKVQAMKDIAQNDKERARATQGDMNSSYYQGYYLAEEDMHTHYLRRLKDIRDDLTTIIEEAGNV